MRISFSDEQTSRNASSRAAFPFHIAAVIGMSANEEMRGANADPIVAMVADKQASGDFSSLESPNDTMSKRRSVIFTAPDYAVASASDGAAPQPAVADCGIGSRDGPIHVHLLPEALRKRSFSHRRHYKGSRR